MPHDSILLLLAICVCVCVWVECGSAVSFCAFELFLMCY